MRFGSRLSVRGSVLACEQAFGSSPAVKQWRTTRELASRQHRIGRRSRVLGHRLRPGDDQIARRRVVPVDDACRGET